MDRKLLQNLFEKDVRLKRRIDNKHYDFCQMWQAFHVGAGKECVVKVFDLDKTPQWMLTDEGTVREIAYRRKLKCYQFGKFLEAGELENDDLRIGYIITQYIYGARRLSDYLKQYGSLTKLDRKDNDILELASAINELGKVTHGGGHYNLCPENILLNPEGIYLTGLTHLCEPISGNISFENDEMTVGYRPQENFHDIFNNRTDIYAFGMILCQMLGGKYPYPLEHPEATITQERYESLKNALQQPPMLDSLGRKMKELVSNILAKNYKDMKEVLNDLGVALGMGRMIDNSECSAEIFDERMQEGRACEAEFEKKKGKGFAEVAGMNLLKKKLTRDFVKVIQNKDLAKAYGITPPNIILYGPPGCGKTYIANRLAEESGIAYSYVKPSDLGSCYVHGTQGKIADLFDKAAQQAPCILCIDEIDSLLSKRGDSEYDNKSTNDEVAEWLTQLNNCTERGIYVVGMTNRISALDEAVIRRGRFDATFYVPLPDLEERKQLFQLSLGHCPADKEIDLNALAKMTERYSSSDIVSLVKEASRNAFEQSLDQKTSAPIPVSQEMLEQTIAKAHPSVSSTSLKRYEQEREKFEHGNEQRKMIGFR